MTIFKTTFGVMVTNFRPFGRPCRKFTVGATRIGSKAIEMDHPVWDTSDGFQKFDQDFKK